MNLIKELIGRLDPFAIQCDYCKKWEQKDKAYIEYWWPNNLTFCARCWKKEKRKRDKEFEHDKKKKLKAESKIFQRMLDDSQKEYRRNFKSNRS